MTYVREGSWTSFRRALAAVEVDDETAVSTGRITTRLSEMAHARFFIDGGNRWHVFAPLLGGLSETSQAVLSGGRTPRLVDELTRSCKTEGCDLRIAESPDGPDSIHVTGRLENLARAARGAGIHYLPHFARTLCAQLRPIAGVLSSAAPGAPPTNWSVRSFDLQAFRWVDGLLPDAAYEYRSRHGGLRHFVRGPMHALLELDRRQSVYAAAYLNRVALVSYDQEQRTLSVPRGAPFPEAMARAAASCSGTPALEHDNRLVYRDVPSSVAGVLMAASGQRPPKPRWLSNERGQR
jgi:hypothetical protein